MKVAIGVDIGGTNIKLGALDARGRRLAKAMVPTRAREGVRAVLDQIDLGIRRLGVKAGAIGVGAPGPLDAARTKVITAVHLPGWRNVPLPALVKRRTGLPTILENDANCAGVGEALYGVGRGATCFVLYTLGTGIGGAVILNGELWTGRMGGAGELGHVTIDRKGRRCGCGSRGCVERYVNGPAVARAFNEACDALGAAIASVVHVLHPDVVAIGGGVSAAGRRLLGRIRRATFARIFPSFRKGLRIELATLGNDAGWIGAAHLALHR